MKYTTLNWSRISDFMGRKFKPYECKVRYNRVVNPVLKKHERWTTCEDSALIECVEKYGSKWSLISKEIKGRCDTKCRGILYITYM